jgi:ATP-dependent exoDNAse (exonuclease V) beta subunit
MSLRDVSDGSVHSAFTNSAPMFAPLGFPLRGSQLIEASAGTGKTFAIASLYLRLVLGHGGPSPAAFIADSITQIRRRGGIPTKLA